MRGNPPGAAHLLAPDGWKAGQAFGRKAWEAHADGIVYPSVREPEGECAAVLRPPVLSAIKGGFSPFSPATGASRSACRAFGKQDRLCQHDPYIHPVLG
ncbi:RES family NAD+ phosphorylase [Halomonas sp. ML-15]|uniref:RES family NAD+ phosphorylase n=1 Tax=Halomonas sp. ML-15 TaxID=2773305 RepID=UPI0021E368A5|nr:RES family NAD+ phosphorylase [Halomonas sp. ML-15]